MSGVTAPTEWGRPKQLHAKTAARPSGRRLVRSNDVKREEVDMAAPPIRGDDDDCLAGRSLRVAVANRLEPCRHAVPIGATNAASWRGLPAAFGARRVTRFYPDSKTQSTRNAGIPVGFHRRKYQ